MATALFFLTLPLSICLFLKALLLALILALAVLLLPVFPISLKVPLLFSLLALPFPGDGVVVTSVAVAVQVVIKASIEAATIISGVAPGVIAATTARVRVITAARVIAGIIVSGILLVVISPAATLGIVFIPTIPGIPTGRMLLPPVHDDSGREGLDLRLTGCCLTEGVGQANVVAGGGGSGQRG